jgi:hypothetical protein
VNLTTYARAVLGEAFEDLAEPARPVERPNRLGPPVVVLCMGCLARDRVRRAVAECTYWDDYLTGRA